MRSVCLLRTWISRPACVLAILALSLLGARFDGAWAQVIDGTGAESEPTQTPVRPVVQLPTPTPTPGFSPTATERVAVPEVLQGVAFRHNAHLGIYVYHLARAESLELHAGERFRSASLYKLIVLYDAAVGLRRSGARRVGKEWRSRWSTLH